MRGLLVIKMNLTLNYKKRKISLEVEKCKWKFLGLMFSRRENAKALLFYFKKPVRIPIHSFFCPEFLAVWLDNKNEVLEVKKIKPWRFCVLPKKSFVKLIEIPVNKKYYNILVSLDEGAKSLKTKIN